MNPDPQSDMIRHVTDDPSGLSPRARRFVQVHGARIETWTAEQHRQHWTQLGRPAAAVEQLVAFQQRWGGLVLPPAAHYEGGPKVLDADDPDVEDDGLVFSAGYPRCSVPYSYAVDVNGRFGICGEGSWVPLHASIEGWVEALALTYQAREDARTVRRVIGPAADDLIAGVETEMPVGDVAGIADNWWQQRDSLVAVFRGEALHFGGCIRPLVLIFEGVYVTS